MDNEVKELINKIIQNETPCNNEKEKKYITNIFFAYRHRNEEDIITAILLYAQFQKEYILELEKKVKRVDNKSTITKEILKKNSTIWEKGKQGKVGKTSFKVLKFIHDFINQNGICPTVREIANGVNLKSTSSVHSHMQKLEQLGYIKKNPMSPRNLKINEEKYMELIKNRNAE